MKCAGYTGKGAFSQSAKTALFARTGGIPREINRVCKLALDRAFALGSTCVEEEIVEEIFSDIFRQSAMV